MDETSVLSDPTFIPGSPDEEAGKATPMKSKGNPNQNPLLSGDTVEQSL